MTIAAQLRQSLAIITPTAAGALDAYGQPLLGEPLVRLVRGLIFPKTTRELALASQAGAEVSTHTVFVLPPSVVGAAYVRLEPDDGDRFWVTGVRDYPFGPNAHVELDVRRIASAALPAEGS